MSVSVYRWRSGARSLPVTVDVYFDGELIAHREVLFQRPRRVRPPSLISLVFGRRAPIARQEVLRFRLE